MELILLERVEKLGQMGDVVSVKDGYARNFLLPNRKALRATEANQKVFEGQRKEIEARNLEAKSEAEGVATKMDGASVVLLRQAGETGQLYGSVTSRDIAAAVRDEGYQVRRGQVILARPIKEIGLHDVSVRLHPEVSVDVKVNVARTAEEAEIQVGVDTAAEDVFESEDLAEAAVEALTDTPEVELSEEELAAAAEKAAKKAARKAAKEEVAEADSEGEDAAPAEEASEEAPEEAPEEAASEDAPAEDASEEAEKSE